jgi:DNA-binding transcriptional LysR family regulator
MGNDTTLEQIPAMMTFARVVESGSFTEAARRLGCSKASVSKQIARLEEHLGAQLLRRTTRRMSLTEAGEGFYGHCARIAEEAEAASHKVGRLQSAPRGLLRIAAPASFGQLHVARLVTDFLGRFPEVNVDLRLSDQTVDLVEEGFDVAIRIGSLPDSTLIARRLAPCRLVLAASPEYLRRKGTPSRPSDLRGHDCIVYFGGHDVWNFTRGRSVRVAGRLGVNNGEGVREAALAGAGICFLPTFLLGDDIRAGRLEAVLIDHVESRISFHAVYPPTRHLTRKVRSFVDFIAEKLGREPPWDEFFKDARAAG